MTGPRPGAERCPQCDSRVFIDDLHCVNCGAELIYDTENGTFTLTAVACQWRVERLCNWSAMVDGPECRACRRTSVSDAAAQRGDLVAIYCAAIRRTLRRLHDGFGVDPATVGPDLHYCLELSDPDHPVTIGHADGLITLDVAEADPVHLEAQRLSLGEPYRTPLGHVRHETGHWLWAASVDPNPLCLDEFRRLFGDEQVDYQDALAGHYQQADDGIWQTGFVSHYAAAHPWEDFAESTAHVLHIDDVLNVASIARLVSSSVDDGFPVRYGAWTELVVELNEVARAMGESDVYPFAPPPAAVDKMRFAEQALRNIAVPLCDAGAGPEVQAQPVTNGQRSGVGT